MQDLSSALTTALLCCGALDEALEAATGTATGSLDIAESLPSLKTFNMLLAALARESRLVSQLAGICLGPLILTGQRVGSCARDPVLSCMGPFQHQQSKL